MKILPGNAQHVGRRNSQQDEFWFSDINDLGFVAHGGVMAIVADGMGGMEKGGEASRLATRTFSQAYLAKAASDPIPDALKNALAQANEAVCLLSRSVDGFNNVGTTLVAAVVAGQSLYWVSVGDSRLYLFRQGVMTQLTQDHNYGEMLQKKVADGQLSPDEAERDPRRNALTSYLGLPELDVIDCNPGPYPLYAGDWVMLCSDGLYGTLGERELSAELFGEPQEAADCLIRRVLDKNRAYQDNATVTIMAYQADGFKPAPRDKWRRVWKPSKPWVALLGIGLLLASVWGASRYLGRASPVPSTVQVAPHPAAVPAPVQDDPRIGELMRQAEADMKANHLTAPQNGNALDKYTKVLELRPGYGPAREALEDMGERLTTRALQAMDAGKAGKAQQLLLSAGKAKLATEPGDQWNKAQRRLDDMRSKTGAGKAQGQRGEHRAR